MTTIKAQKNYKITMVKSKTFGNRGVRNISK